MQRVIIKNTEIFNNYNKLWADYTAARASLNELALAYRSVDKFAEDFPEYKKYLPPKIIKSNLPAIQIDDVRIKLAGLGIPPTANIS